MGNPNKAVIKETKIGFGIRRNSAQQLAFSRLIVCDINPNPSHLSSSSSWPNYTKGDRIVSLLLFWLNSSAALVKEQQCS